MWIDRRILTIGLAVSLLCNVFFVGLVGVRAYAARHVFRPPGPLIPAVNVRALPQDQRKAYRQAIGRHRGTLRDLREAHRQIRLTTETDIAAPSFDRARVESDFVELRKANLALQQAFNDALIDAVQDLPQSARAMLVRRNANPPAGAR